MEEIEALAGEKEGCADDIEFIQRPIPSEGPSKVREGCCNERIDDLYDGNVGQR